jgi:hypothetical protein
MFEIMSKSRIRIRVMLTARPRDDFGIKSRLFVIGAKVNGETVLEGVFYYLHGRMSIAA